MSKSRVTDSKNFEPPAYEFFQNYNANSNEKPHLVLIDTPTHEIANTGTREIEGNGNGRNQFLVREIFFSSVIRAGFFLKGLGDHLIRWANR
jgi:hypothetical protein